MILCLWSHSECTNSGPRLCLLDWILRVFWSTVVFSSGNTIGLLKGENFSNSPDCRYIFCFRYLIRCFGRLSIRFCRLGSMRFILERGDTLSKPLLVIAKREVQMGSESARISHSSSKTRGLRFLILVSRYGAVATRWVKIGFRLAMLCLP